MKAVEAGDMAEGRHAAARAQAGRPPLVAALAGADAPSRIELMPLGPAGLHWHAQLDSLRVQAEVWNRRKDGKLFPAWLAITAVPHAVFAVTRHVATMVDIAQPPQADEEALSRLAFCGPLKGLPNRRLAKERLHRRWS